MSLQRPLFVTSALVLMLGISNLSYGGTASTLPVSAVGGPQAGLINFIPDCVKSGDPNYKESNPSAADPAIVACCIGLAPVMGAVCATDIFKEIIKLIPGSVEAACKAAVKDACKSMACDQIDYNDKAFEKEMKRLCAEGCSKTADQFCKSRPKSKAAAGGATPSLHGAGVGNFIPTITDICKLAAQGAGALCKSQRPQFPPCSLQCDICELNPVACGGLSCPSCCDRSCPSTSPVSKRSCMKRCEANPADMRFGTGGTSEH